MMRNQSGSVCFAVLALILTAPTAFAADDLPLPTSGPIAAPNAAPHVQFPVKMLNQPAPATAAPSATDWKALQSGGAAPVPPAPVSGAVNTYSAAKPAITVDKPATAVEIAPVAKPATTAATPVAPAAIPTVPVRDPAVAARAAAIIQSARGMADETPAKTRAAAPVVAPAPAQTAVVAPAKPQVTLAIDIDLTRQRMTVAENGQQVGQWPISSGRDGFRSPTGTYRPLWSAKMWYSKKYENAPMPNAVFFSGGVAMHATQATGMLGRPASHGCIRQSPANAATTYRLVAKHGNAHTKITVHGTPRDSEPRVANRDRSRAAVQVASRENRVVDRHSQMRRVILVDGSGNRRIAEIPANDPRLFAYQNRQQGGRSFW
jgi:lipoprotein-anchoring transpeptidase ErfK/SrfK